MILGLHTFPASLCPDHPDWMGEADRTFCYRDMKITGDFITSVQLCSNINTTMAMPKNSVELSQLSQFMGTVGKKSAWIYMASRPFPGSTTTLSESTTLPGYTTQLSHVLGLTSTFPPIQTPLSSPALPVFQWLDGSDLTETFWDGWEPNGDGECVEIIAALQAWNDLSCYPTQRNTICQAPNHNQPENITNIYSTTDDSQLETTLDPSDGSTPDIPKPETSSSTVTHPVHSTSADSTSTPADSTSTPADSTSTPADSTSTSADSTSTTADSTLTTADSTLTSGLPLSNVTQLNSTCSMHMVCGSNKTYSTWQLSAKIALMQADLTVVKSKLSSTRRTKSSAEDARTSSTSMGILGGIVIVMIYLCICLLDFVKVKVQPKKVTLPHTYC